MKLFFRILVPILILAGSVAIFRWMMATRPEAQLRQPPPVIQSVEATRLVAREYQVILKSQGRVQPRTESTLKPEVSGRIESIAPNFRDGGFFTEGDVLLQIDSRDYTTALVVASATLKLKESELELEQAQHEQAKENWQLLGDGTAPNPLTLREPQLGEAIADVASATSMVQQAERDLARTKITAPYTGRIKKKFVDMGQFVSPGNDLAAVFAIDYVEIRLPIHNRQLDYIQLPEEYRDGTATNHVQFLKVILHGAYGSRDVTWRGLIVRAEGVYDDATTQLFVVAQVDDPYARSGRDKPPLKVGQFVEADILGDMLKEVFVIPRGALRENREVFVIDQENKIRRRIVQPVWKDDRHVIIRDGLEAGQVLCLSSLLFAADGASVSPIIDGVPPQIKGPPGRSRGPGTRQGPQPAGNLSQPEKPGKSQGHPTKDLTG